MATLDGDLARIEEALQRTLSYWQLRRLIKEEVVKPKYRELSCQEALQRVLQANGMLGQLCNVVDQVVEAEDAARGNCLRLTVCDKNVNGR